MAENLMQQGLPPESDSASANSSSISGWHRRRELARMSEQIPRDYSVVPKKPCKVVRNALPQERGAYRLEPVIQPLPNNKTLTYYPDEAPVDYKALYNIEKTTPSGHNPAIYKPKGETVSLDSLDPNSDLYKMWKLDFEMGEAWVKGQDSFLMDKQQEYVPMRHPEVASSSTDQLHARHLAQRENFSEICQASLWGVEEVKPAYRKEFANLLRAVVENYLPRNRWDLILLRDVVDLQWKIQRFTLLQKNVYNAGQAGTNNMGIPIKSTNAASLNNEIAELRAQLSRAIQTYWKSRKA
jgi:hypothetical protein